ncbi:hypothetical protein GCM10027596_35950 [Nocardioides korecus]
METPTGAGVTPANENAAAARADTRLTKLQVLIGLVALSGAAGLVGLFVPAPAMYESDGWASNRWVLASFAGLICAAAAAVLGRRRDAVVAVGAAVVLLAFAADSNAQGPFIALPAFLACLLVVATGAWALWTVALERAS